MLPWWGRHFACCYVGVGLSIPVDCLDSLVKRFPPRQHTFQSLPSAPLLPACAYSAQFVNIITEGWVVWLRHLKGFTKLTISKRMQQVCSLPWKTTEMFAVQYIRSTATFVVVSVSLDFAKGNWNPASRIRSPFKKWTKKQMKTTQNEVVYFSLCVL